MHELSVAQAALDAAREAALEAGADSVLSIDIVVGGLTSFVDDSVQFYFDILSTRTIAANATLRFRRVAAVAHCRACGHVTPVQPPLPELCAACGSMQLRVSGGREFYIDQIEVADGSADRTADPEGE